MKIYLLITLIGFLLTAVRFTSVPETQSKTRAAVDVPVLRSGVCQQQDSTSS